MASKVSFNSSDDVIVSKYSVEEITILDDLDCYFEIDRCVKFINKSNFVNVALQFPDELMRYAQNVSSAIEVRVNKKVFVLADTSYGSCCVDEVAAAHLNADSIIHFGHTCLSSTEKLPVLYVFGTSNVNCTDLLLKAKDMFSNSQEMFIIFYDVVYYRSIQAIKQSIVNNFSNAVFTEIGHINKYFPDENLNDCEENEVTTLGRKYLLKTDLSKYKILYIGNESLTLHNLLMTLNKNQFYLYNPSSKEIRKETVSVNKMLMKRFYLIERAKDAQIVGIVMGTLAVERYKEMVARLKQILNHAGKKFYTFVVGKINVAKMANFMEIDIFVLVACPENSLIDSKEFFKPIVTPYEMEIACLESRQWTGDYFADFRKLLPGSPLHVDVDENSEIEREPEFSLITGKLRGNLRISDQTQSSVVMLRNQETQLTTQHPMSAIEHLTSRTWQGLEINSGKTEVKKTEEGRSGIAMSYTHEPQQ